MESKETKTKKVTKKTSIKDRSVTSKKKNSSLEK